jgi:hypothetical protein
LNINTGLTLRGAGLIEELAMQNQVTIHTDGNKAIIFELKGDLFTNNVATDVTGDVSMQIRDNEVVNNGIVNVQSSLSVQNEFTQQAGELQVNGELIASTVIIDKGILEGSGVVDADVVINADGRIGRGS